jgi:hypothetical protein
MWTLLWRCTREPELRARRSAAPDGNANGLGWSVGISETGGAMLSAGFTKTLTLELNASSGDRLELPCARSRGLLAAVTRGD